MNMDSSMCASSGDAPPWEQLDWPQCERNVRRLQARIVKATQAGRWGKVKALQRLLTHSFSGKALAVKRVTENQGKRTPGVDGAIWEAPGVKYKSIGSLRRRGYQPQPLRRVHIPKDAYGFAGVPLEARLGDLAAVFISRWRVKLPKPALIF